MAEVLSVAPHFDEDAYRGRVRGRLREVGHDVTQLQSSGSGQSLTYLGAAPDRTHVHTYATFACHADVFYLRSSIGTPEVSSRLIYNCKILSTIP